MEGIRQSDALVVKALLRQIYKALLTNNALLEKAVELLASIKDMTIPVDDLVGPQPGEPAEPGQGVLPFEG